MARAKAKQGRPLAAAFIPLPDYRPPLTAQAKARADAGSWYDIRNATADEAELLLYDEIGGWFGTWADEFVEDLKAITAPRLRVRVNSPGGSVFEGIALANALRGHPAQVTVQVDGIAASIASVIAMAADRVEMCPQATMMIHDASGLCVGDATEMTKMADVLDMLSDNIADAYAERGGGTREEWRTRMKAETWYLAEEAVAAGLADVVLPARQQPEEPADDAPMNRAWDLSVFRYAGREDAPDPATATAAPDSQPAAQPTAVAVSISPQEFGAQLLEVIRAGLSEEAASADETTVATADGDPETAAQPDDPAPASWADQTAHLYADDSPDDDWAQLAARLTTSDPLTPSSSAATA